METQVPTSNAQPSSNIFIPITWVSSVILAVIIGYMFGQSAKPSTTPNNVLAATQTIPTSTPPPSPTLTQMAACTKTGLAQKWEFLTSYVVKDGDSLQTIATNELGDSSRVSEILQLNGLNPLVVGSTIYLPPLSIKKSSGNITQASGRLVEKDANNWHISFNGDINGQSLYLPSFWFGEITDKDTYKVGDCITVLFDNGFKVFSVELQK